MPRQHYEFPVAGLSEARGSCKQEHRFIKDDCFSEEGREHRERLVELLTLQKSEQMLEVNGALQKEGVRVLGKESKFPNTCHNFSNHCKALYREAQGLFSVESFAQETSWLCLT